MPIRVLFAFVSVVAGIDRLKLQADDPPKSADSRIVVEPFATSPDLVHPVGATFDKRGRLLVVESHTHFRPENYSGPKHDRIRVVEDTNGDGKADRFTTFFEGTDATMGIATHSDGSIYVATRNEILRLRDTNGSGVAHEKTRLLFLDTKADYPHNGISGLVFDANGDLYFGMGENKGDDYKLIGADGRTLTGGGEGGNVYWCTAAGKKLRRVATGFWNPFGLSVDRHRNLFVVDNDPDASPPCRMIHVVEAGDYGYQYRYGRSGRHVFQAWNGELPGTLPQMSGTGEAPCQIVDYRGENLPREYVGDLLVASWADHRIERYRIKQRGTSFAADRLPFISSAGEFRPVGIAVAPDGSLYVSDWVLKDYQLHGKGAIWHIQNKNPQRRLQMKGLAIASARTDAIRDAVAAAREMAFKDRRPFDLLNSEDPFVRCEAVRRLAESSELSELANAISTKDRWTRIGLLMALRQSENRSALSAIPGFLADSDPEIRFLAVKWIADDKLAEFRPKLVEALANPKLDVRMCMAVATALARLDGREVKESDMADYFFQRLVAKDGTPSARAMAIRLIPANYSKWNLKQLIGWLNEDNVELRLEVVRLANESNRASLTPALLAFALDAESPAMIRAEAAVGWSRWAQPDEFFALTADKCAAVRDEALRGLIGAQLTSKQRSQLQKTAKEHMEEISLVARVLGKPFHDSRPALTDLDAWLKFLDGPADADAGRRVFSNAKLTGCTNCHRMDGRGQNVGPDLSTIGRIERRAILESILQPSKSIAPSYQAWNVVTTDGRVRSGLLVNTSHDECTYVDPKGERFMVVAKDVEETRPSQKSIMPDSLVDQLTDREIRDLLAYLSSRR